MGFSNTENLVIDCALPQKNILYINARNKKYQKQHYCVENSGF
jgi:hypothetical protein